MTKFIIKEMQLCYVSWEWAVEAISEEAAIELVRDGLADQHSGPDLDDGPDFEPLSQRPQYHVRKQEG